MPLQVSITVQRHVYEKNVVQLVKPSRSLGSLLFDQSEFDFVLPEQISKVH